MLPDSVSQSQPIDRVVVERVVTPKISQLYAEEFKEGDIVLFDIDGTLITTDESSPKQLVDKDRFKSFRCRKNSSTDLV
ncbi:MAG: hypothetical protein ACD_21C00107G0009 [uncultured bacterium]|nr:MAG: hypothetical protein ACD_21C00107G0009 [uncultured bacterium]